jgi:hypothetical protein
MKTGANFFDANLIQVAPERWDTGRLACLYRGTFDRICILSEVLKECVKKEMLGMGVASLKNKGHALFSKSWA